MNDLQKATEPKDKRSLQERHFDKLYDVFFRFYQAEISKADAPYKKVRLQLTTVFFDDLALLKLVQPVFQEYGTNVEEKRAVARAAYFDALTIHNRTAGMKFETASEKDIQKGNF